MDFSNSFLLVSRNFSSISFEQQVFEFIVQYLSEMPGGEKKKEKNLKQTNNKKTNTY